MWIETSAARAQSKNTPTLPSPTYDATARSCSGIRLVAQPSSRPSVFTRRTLPHREGTVEAVET